MTRSSEMPRPRCRIGKRCGYFGRVRLVSAAQTTTAVKTGCSKPTRDMGPPLKMPLCTTTLATDSGSRSP
jgi:hypothetical protein